MRTINSKNFNTGITWVRFIIDLMSSLDTGWG